MPRRYVLLASLLAAGFLVAACNSHPVEYTESSAVVERTEPGPTVGGANKVDVLWVIDNSGSMCEEQRSLRESFRTFVDVVTESAADFHVGVTTTHFSRRNSPVELEPIAEGGRLQSTPSPVPFPSKACRFAADATGAPKDGEGESELDFGPIKTSVNQAVACAKDDYPNLKDPSQERIACALYGADPPSHVTNAIGSDNPCADSGATKHGGRIFPNDLFPCGSQHDPEGNPRDLCPAEKMRNVYRDIPKVIRAGDSRYQTDGELDRDKLVSDFACMSFVGTRGNGAAEQGLKAMNRAISPDMTGGPDESPVEDLGGESAPNHGLIRKNANFATIFITDENDCSYNNQDDQWADYIAASDASNMKRDSCGGANCYFPTRNADDQSPLQNIDSLVETFKSNLAESKQISKDQVEEMIQSEEGGVTMASIDGGYEPFSGQPPAQCDDPEGNQPLRCAGTSGRIYTADRYHDFLRQFGSHYPVEGEGLGSRSKMPSEGLLCQGSFETALEKIAGELGTDGGNCIQRRVSSCGDGGSCPEYQYGGGQGQCTCWGEKAGGGCPSGYKFCDSAIQVRLKPNNPGELDDVTGALQGTGACYGKSIGTAGFPKGCVVKRSEYEWVPCPGNRRGAISLSMAPGNVQVDDLSGFNLQIRYAVETGDSPTGGGGGSDAASGGNDAGSAADGGS